MKKKEKLFKKVYDTYNRYIYVCARNFCNRHKNILDIIYEIDDVMQIVYMNIWKYIGCYDSKKGKLKTYIINNMKRSFTKILTLSLYEKRQVWKKTSLDYEYNNVEDDIRTLYDIIPDGSFENIEMRIECMLYKKFLYKKYHKEIFEYLQQGYTYGEIGDKLGFTRQRVEQIICQIRDIIQRKEGMYENRKVY